MIIKAITVENIGLFRGMNEFLLTNAGNGQRSMAVAVAGKNGVGKTTLFRAAPLALHGALSVGDRVSQRDYAAFLSDLLHRTVGPDGYRQRTRKGRISVEIAYVRSGRAHTATITREFRADGARVADELFLDSDELDHQVRDPQAWVNDLLPPSVASVWLFDAEDLGRLIGSEERAAYLKRTFQRLLGVHLVERLVADLHYHVLKSGAEEVEPLRVKLLEAKATYEEAARQRTDVEAALDEVREAKLRATQTLRQLESELAAEGGVYARLRDQNTAEASDVAKKISRIEDRLRQQFEGLLPLAASRRVHQLLLRRLQAPEVGQGSHYAHAAWSECIDAVFTDNEFLLLLEREVGVCPERNRVLRNALVATGERVMEGGAADPKPATAPLHDMSTSERRQILEWLLASGDVYRSQLRESAMDLAGLRDRLSELKSELRRAPDNDRLAPINTRIADVQRTHDLLEAQQDELLRRLGESEKRLQDSERRFDRARKDFEAAQRHDRGVDLAIRTRNATAVFQDALIGHKLSELETGILNSFNAVCRKQHLLSGVRIDPKTFRTELRGYRGHSVVLEEFSAGERQLYNMAVFKAMRDVSGLDLPFFIDTPFARLDATHRRRLIGGYFQELANQVVLFMTDAEGQALETQGTSLLDPRAYWLEADLVRQATAVSTISVAELIMRARETVAA